MKKVTRKQAQAWLAPIRASFAQIKQGEVDAIKGYPVTRLDEKDTYCRVDWCIAGFRGMLSRVCPGALDGSLERIEKKLANGVPLTMQEIDGALTVLKHCEDAMVGLPVAFVLDAVVTEQLCIEFDELGLAA